METMLVTGGAGFIGCNFVRYALAHTEARVIVIDKLTYAGSSRSLDEVAHHPRFALTQADIGDRRAINALFVMKILLTGANGQLGRALQMALKHHHVVALAHDQIDITRLDQVLAAVQYHRPRLAINAAAFNDVNGAESRCDEAFRINAVGPRNLAVATAAHGVPLLHLSTDYVFDGTTRRPYHEYDRSSPLSIYGASKLAGEEAVRTHNPRHYIVRTAWLYHTVGRNFPKTMCGLAKNPEVCVVSDQIGSPTYAPHLAEAISHLIETGAYETYHLVGRGEASWFELAQTLYRKLGIQTPVRPISRVAFARVAVRPRYTVLTTVQAPAIL